MPFARIVEVEEAFGGSMNVDQCAAVVEAVLRVESKLERAGASVEYGERVEVCVLIESGSLLEQARRTLKQKYWIREDDREQYLAGGRVSVVGDCTECDTGAKGHATRLWSPLVETRHSDRIFMVPNRLGWKRIPLLLRQSVWFHVHRE